MSITRFKEAQERFGGYETALEEIRQGQKRSHWIWYIFPQLKGLGRSFNSEHYGIASLDEAKEYLGDPVLKERLLEISGVLLEHKGEDIHRIMGGIANSGINVPLVAVCNVPPVARSNVPPQKWLR